VLMVGTYNAMLSQNEAKKIKDPDLETFALTLFEKLKAAYPDVPTFTCREAT